MHTLAHFMSSEYPVSQLKNTINEAICFETEPGATLLLINCRLALVVQSAKLLV